MFLVSANGYRTKDSELFVPIVKSNITVTHQNYLRTTAAYASNYLGISKNTQQKDGRFEEIGTNLK